MAWEHAVLKIFARLATAAGSHKTSPDQHDVGELVDSSRDRDKPHVLRDRLQEDGYLLLRHVVDPARINAIGNIVAAEMSRYDSVGSSRYRVLEHLGSRNEALGLVRDTALVKIFSQLFGCQAVSMDFAWIRACGENAGSDVHADWVYMSRGTHNVISAWIPLIDVPREMGPLMILEKSHQNADQLNGYLDIDADRLGLFNGLRWKHGNFTYGGRYSRNSGQVASELGRRWLTADFDAGDMAIFLPTCLHATLPNRTSDWRFSVDARFQPAGEVMDPRFVGPKPVLRSGRDKHIADYARDLVRRIAGRATERVYDS